MTKFIAWLAALALVPAWTLADTRAVTESPDAVINSARAFKAVGSGAVARTVAGKLREKASVVDYGAKCDGTSNDQPAFQKAANASTLVLVPYSATACLLGSDVTAKGVHFQIEGQLSGPGRLIGATVTQFDSSNFKVGDKGLFGYPDNALALQSYGDIGPAAPSGIVHANRFVAQAKGTNKTFVGVAAGYFEARDRPDVTASNKGVLYALSLSVVPSVGRNNVPYDDVDGLTIMNSTGTAGARGTDAIYIGHNESVFPNSSEFYSGMTLDVNADVGVRLGGRYATYGLDFGTGLFPTSAVIRLPNAGAIYSRNNTGAGDVPVISLDNNNVIELGGPNVSGTQVKNWFGTTVPVVVSASAYTVGYNDNYIIFTSACLVTLPPADAFAGRVLHVKTTGLAVNSNATNVVPLAGGSAGAAILGASAGKWAEMVSDGANWQVMAGN